MRKDSCVPRAYADIFRSAAESISEYQDSQITALESICVSWFNIIDGIVGVMDVITYIGGVLSPCAMLSLRAKESIAVLRGSMLVVFSAVLCGAASKNMVCFQMGSMI